MQEQERPLLRLKNQMLLSLSQQEDYKQLDRYLDDESASKLRMDDYMSMKIQQSMEDSPECTTSCVANCGRLAELPHT